MKLENFDRVIEIKKLIDEIDNDLKYLNNDQLDTGVTFGLRRDCSQYFMSAESIGNNGEAMIASFRSRIINTLTGRRGDLIRELNEL